MEMMLNNFQISPREQEVLRSISLGFTTKEIANEMFVSTHTINTHRKHLLEKMKAKNVAGLVRKGFEQGILQTR